MELDRNIHNILPLAGKLWLGESQQGRTRKTPQMLQWELPDSDADGERSRAGAAAIFPVVGTAAQAAQAADPSESWIAFNKQQKA